MAVSSLHQPARPLPNCAIHGRTWSGGAPIVMAWVDVKTGSGIIASTGSGRCDFKDRDRSCEIPPNALKSSQRAGFTKREIRHKRPRIPWHYPCRTGGGRVL